MTIPDDRPPLPEEGMTTRTKVAAVLFAAAFVCAIAACALAGPHVPVTWVPPAAVGTVAVVLLVAAFAVLAGKGRQS